MIKKAFFALICVANLYGVESLESDKNSIASNIESTQDSSDSITTAPPH